MRAERAEQVAREKAERTAQAVYAKTVKTESRNLDREVAAEVKATKQWLAEAGTSKFTAPPSTWSGPARWNGGARPSRRENRNAVAAGRVRYGAAFEEARARYAGEYSAAEILEACERLESQGRDRITGRVRPNNWYGGYTTVDDSRIGAARAEQFAKAFPDAQVQGLSTQYVAANLNGVLWRARGGRPRGPRRAEAVMVLRARVARAVAQARRSLAQPSGAAPA